MAPLPLHTHGNRILLITDDPGLPALFERYKDDDSLGIDQVAEARGGVRRAVARPYPLVVADNGLPGMREFELCRTLRHRLPHLLLLAVCGPRGGEFDRTVALELGADDAVTRPVSPRELVARAKALLRRGRGQPDGMGPVSGDGRLRFGLLEVDFTRRRVERDAARVPLSATELKLFLHLAARSGRAVTRGELVRAVWGPNATGLGSAVSALVGRVRAKIEPAPARPRYILTVQGVGYRFVEADGVVGRAAG